MAPNHRRRFGVAKGPVERGGARSRPHCRSGGVMVFFGVNHGELTSFSGGVKHYALYLVGNPVIANKIISIETTTIVGTRQFINSSLATFDCGQLSAPVDRSGIHA
jgi:hypothetical protein